MSMDLETALGRVEVVRQEAAKSGELYPSAALDAEALRLVLDAARSASVVDLTNAAVARARDEAAAGQRPHRFATLFKNTLGYCIHCSRDASDPIHGQAAAIAASLHAFQGRAYCHVCGRDASDPIHQKPETTP